MMRVLHVLDHSVPHRSGYAMRTRSIVRFQRELGISPVVITSPRHGPAESAIELIDGIPHHRFSAGRESALRGVGRRLPVMSERRQIIDMAAAIRRLIEGERIDVVHAHSPSLNGLAALKAARSTRTPVVYEIRAFWEDAAVDQGKFGEGSWKYRLSRAVESYLLRRVDRIVVICEGLRRELVRRGFDGEKIHVAPNGVDAAAFTGQGDDSVRERFGLTSHTVIGFIGSFYRYEGLELLVEAVSRLRESHPNVKALLVGGGEVEAELVDQVKRLDLRDRVLFAGSVPHAEVRNYYAAMDVMAYPRVSRRITEYTTPLKPLEAMALGKLVVGSNVGGIAELIEDRRTGFLFRAGSVEDLTATLRAVLSDDPGHREIRDAAVEEISASRQWPQIVSCYRSVYEEVAGRPAAVHGSSVN